MVAQLEHQLRIGRLSLQAMWFYCQVPPPCGNNLANALRTRHAAVLMTFDLGSVHLAFDSVGGLCYAICRHYNLSL